MSMPAHEGLLAPSDIADLAGVSRAAVSNWRKRMSDFPEPTEGTASKPLFAAKDIEAWLTAHPEKRKPGNSADSSTRAWEARLWGVANLFRGHVDVHDFGELFLRTAGEFVDGRPSLASRNVSQRSLDELRDALETIPRADLPAAIDGLLERTSRALGKAGGETGFVGSRTSTLLASLAADVDGGTLYDPACGIGVALLQALDMGATPDRLVGNEINATAAEIAADDNARQTTEGAEDGRWLAFRAVDLLPTDTAIKVAVGPGTPSAEGPGVTTTAGGHGGRHPDMRVLHGHGVVCVDPQQTCRMEVDVRRGFLVLHHVTSSDHALTQQLSAQHLFSDCLHRHDSGRGRHG